jgi:hypothetical protein
MTNIFCPWDDDDVDDDGRTLYNESVIQSPRLALHT